MPDAIQVFVYALLNQSVALLKSDDSLVHRVSDFAGLFLRIVTGEHGYFVLGDVVASDQSFGVYLLHDQEMIDSGEF